MASAISRMQFLRGDFSGRTAPLRPPWSLPEAAFEAHCNRCGDCITRCPTGIIKTGRGDMPVIDFTCGECLFCDDCSSVCEPGAIRKVAGAKPWTITATIDSIKCIAFANVECRSCFDPCEARAINMTPRIGGVAIPALNSTACTGCGACFGICPVHAISMKNSPGVM